MVSKLEEKENEELNKGISKLYYLCHALVGSPNMWKKIFDTWEELQANHSKFNFSHSEWVDEAASLLKVEFNKNANYLKDPKNHKETFQHIGNKLLKNSEPLANIGRAVLWSIDHVSWDKNDKR